MNFNKYLIILLLLFISLDSTAEPTNKVDKKAKSKNSKPAKQVKLNTEKVSEKIHMISGNGGNVAVLTGKEGILLIDSQFSDSYGLLKREIAKLKKGRIDFLINTHWHGDHTGANMKVGKRATVVAHENVRKKLESDQSIEFFKKIIKKQPVNGLPKITFSTTLKIYFNGEEIEIIHFPNGHTDGDAVVFFHQQKVVHMGDLFFSGKFPFVDLEHGGNVLSYRNNIQSLLKLIPKDFTIIPGHGPVSKYADLELFEKMLSMSIDRVKDEKEIGRQLEEIKLNSVIEKFPNFDKGFINEKSWIKLIMDSL